MSKSDVSPQGYNFSGTIHPFWENGDDPEPIGNYLKSVSGTETINDDGSKTYILKSEDNEGSVKTILSWITGEETSSTPEVSEINVTETTTDTGTDYKITYQKNGETITAGAIAVPKGEPGKDGKTATITVGTTTTGEPGTNAIVTNSGSENAAVLNFTIPKGEKGDPGPQGEPGKDGTGAGVTNSLSGSKLEQTIGTTKTEFPSDYVSDIVSTDKTITDTTTTEEELDISGVSPQLLGLNVSTQTRTDETTLTDGSHEIVTGIGLEGQESGSTSKYLYYLVKVFTEFSDTDLKYEKYSIYGLYYRPSDNSYKKVKLLKNIDSNVFKVDCDISDINPTIETPNGITPDDTKMYTINMGVRRFIFKTDNDNSGSGYCICPLRLFRDGDNNKYIGYPYSIFVKDNVLKMRYKVHNDSVNNSSRKGWFDYDEEITTLSGGSSPQLVTETDPDLTTINSPVSIHGTFTGYDTTKQRVTLSKDFFTNLFRISTNSDNTNFTLSPILSSSSDSETDIFGDFWFNGTIQNGNFTGTIEFNIGETFGGEYPENTRIRFMGSINKNLVDSSEIPESLVFVGDTFEKKNSSSLTSTYRRIEVYGDDGVTLVSKPTWGDVFKNSDLTVTYYK